MIFLQQSQLIFGGNLRQGMTGLEQESRWLLSKGYLIRRGFLSLKKVLLLLFMVLILEIIVS
ncbi:hypothetical protein A11A3_12258 [Alcanivorax hongdengensis A-11-3]|uniref:Uncharacterized protein n=1 Tax=Alcanivorax hongdengensis A-11-3 TaxID=1177179 RepID=L0W9U7_9GAMM|nr:hypothetical protein A11A3_12258 [Alcanivorax hongdengensis A-11-3]